MNSAFFWSLIIRLVAFACPFFIFLDYHKRQNIHRSVVYVGVFFLTM